MCMHKQKMYPFKCYSNLGLLNTIEMTSFLLATFERGDYRADIVRSWFDSSLIPLGYGLSCLATSFLYDEIFNFYITLHKAFIFHRIFKNVENVHVDHPKNADYGGRL